METARNCHGWASERLKHVYSRHKVFCCLNSHKWCCRILLQQENNTFEKFWIFSLTWETLQKLNPVSFRSVVLSIDTKAIRRNLGIVTMHNINVPQLSDLLIQSKLELRLGTNIICVRPWEQRFEPLNSPGTLKAGGIKKVLSAIISKSGVSDNACCIDSPLQC